MRTLLAVASDGFTFPAAIAALLVVVGLASYAMSAAASTVEGGTAEERVLAGVLDFRAKSLAAHGLPAFNDVTIRRHTYYEVFDISATALAETVVFTTDKDTNTLKRPGSNFDRPGEIDRDTLFLPLAIAIRPMGLNAVLTQAQIRDWQKICDYGLITELWIGDIIARRDVELGLCAQNVGYTVSPPGALVPEAVHAGQPGLDNMGLELEPWERIPIRGGQKIKAKIVHNQGNPLSAALKVKLSIVGIDFRKNN